MNDSPQPAHLGNWREAPYNQWAFHHVRELIPTAAIHNDPANVHLFAPSSGDKVDSIQVEKVLTRTWTDGFLVLHRGSIVYEWYAPHCDRMEPHILFSVSKSVTGSLAGILATKGQLDVDAPVPTYIPEAAGSAFEDCSVRHVLDMQVGLDFAEVYTGENEQFNRYRAATGWNLPVAGEAPGDLRTFLTSMRRSATPHGTVFQYASPNTDMLGLVLESASKLRLSDLLSTYLWQPMEMESDAYITVDAKGSQRAAGGMCVRLRDLARFGQMMCNGGQLHDKQIIPTDWIEDTLNRGSHEAWQKGGFMHLLPHGRYRNQWYQTGNPSDAFFALGIYGQWIYADPTTEVVIVKVSSQPKPVDDDIDMMLLKFYDELSKQVAGS